MTDKTEIGRAYYQWVTGLDTEPPLDGAFSGGWHARDAEVERLTVELTHRVGWEERCLRAEKRIAELENRPLTEQEQLERYGSLID